MSPLFLKGKIMTKTLAVAVFSFFLSFPAFAGKMILPDGKMGFVSSLDCLNAVKGGVAQAYKPVIKRPLSPNKWEKGTLESLGYTSGICAKGLTIFVSGTWVYLPASFVVGKAHGGEEIKMWQCSNGISEIFPIAKKTQAPVATTTAVAEPCSDCRADPTAPAKFIKEIPSQVCGIETTNGNRMEIRISKEGFLMVKDVRNGNLKGFPGAKVAGLTCDQIQKGIESAPNWNNITQKILGWQECQPKSRQNGVIQGS